MSRQLQRLVNDDLLPMIKLPIEGDLFEHGQ